MQLRRGIRVLGRRNGRLKNSGEGLAQEARRDLCLLRSLFLLNLALRGFRWRASCFGRPDGADRLFLTEAIRRCGAWLVHVIPAPPVRRARETTKARHLHITRGIVLAHPIPSIAQSLVAVALKLLRKPRDLVPAPDPKSCLH